VLISYDTASSTATKKCLSLLEQTFGSLAGSRHGERLLCIDADFFELSKCIVYKLIDFSFGRSMR
jgi:hypothetical protein